MFCLINFSKKALILVTGASKGIGKTLAIELSKKCNPNSIFVLLARSEQALNETKQQILAINGTNTVQTYPVDLSKADIDTYDDILTKVTSTVDTRGVEYGLLIHNAGYVGEIKDATELTDLKAWREYYDLNMFSPVLLNSVFVKRVKSIAARLAVVNITSICGRTPFENLAMYGSGKAARDLFFKVLAVEKPDIIVLNYSPGPVQTDMFDTVCREAESEKVRNSFQEVKKTILTTGQTVEKLLNVLEKGEFESGDTIDYFDRI